MGIGLPSSLNWSNFATVIERGKLVTAFGNSVLYAVAATLIGTTVAALAAYVLSRNRTRLNRYVYFFIIMGIAMPTNFVTLMKVMQITHLINTQFGIILLYAASSIPFSVFLIYAFIETLPRELDEAAIVDGCSPIRLFFSVIYPLLTPVLVTAGVLNLLGIWNEFLLPLYYLNRSTYWPMTLAVYNFFGQFQQDWSLVSADIVLTILPVIVDLPVRAAIHPVRHDGRLGQGVSAMPQMYWKENWAESRQHYLDWWARKGLVISMWEHLTKDGAAA